MCVATDEKVDDFLEINSLAEMMKNLKERYPEATVINISTEAELDRTGSIRRSYTLYMVPLGVVKKSEKSWGDLLALLDR